ncbi:hypothetical protein ACFE04_003816 [Oxalis oulophora]
MKQEPREEFSDWPNGLLAIGTFGNTSDDDHHHQKQSSSSSDHDHLQDFTAEEVGKLQKELTKLLSKKPNSEVEKEIAKLPLDRFLNCPSSLEKMFVCTSGFAPQPSLRDTLQESRMEKLLRTILHKKMHANTSRSSSMKKFIEDKSSNPRNKNNNTSTEDDERKVKITDDGCKWVKTDSEYIVLEI